MRAPVDHIAAPPFPLRLPWINSAPLRMDQLLGHAVLIEFWDFCRPNSIRTLPYMKAWHHRYRDAGLKMIGVHAAGFEPSSDPQAVVDAVERLQVPYPIVVDTELEIWNRYGNLGWPARYLFNQEGMLFDRHLGEGGYDESERAIQELLGVDRPLLEPLRPEDTPGAQLEPQSEDVEGAYSGAYTAGGVWAMLEGTGTVAVNGRALTVDHAGAYELVSHSRSTTAELDLVLEDGIRCYAVCFTPGIAPRGRRAD